LSFGIIIINKVRKRKRISYKRYPNGASIGVPVAIECRNRRDYVVNILEIDENVEKRVKKRAKRGE